MTDSGLFLPFRIYSSLSDTAPQRGECEGFTTKEYFCSPPNRLPPFQISSSSAITDTDPKLIGCGNEIDISYQNSPTTDVIDGVHYLTHIGSAIDDIPEGLYQFHITINGVDHVSDPIFFTNEVDDMPLIIYRGRVDSVQAGIYFKEKFVPECYINSYIEKPEYPIVNETREDGEGNEHHVFQRWEKRRKIIFMGVESMADAMSLLPLMEHVEVNDGRVYDPVPTIMWEDEYGCLARIELSFMTRKAVRSF